MGFRKTSVVIDEDLLASVKGALGTTTVRDTIVGAFRKVLRGRARAEEVQALKSMDGMELADDDVMSGAWRP